MQVCLMVPKTKFLENLFGEIAEAHRFCCNLQYAPKHTHVRTHTRTHAHTSTNTYAHTHANTHGRARGRARAS